MSKKNSILSLIFKFRDGLQMKSERVCEVKSKKTCTTTYETENMKKKDIQKGVLFK